LKIEREYIGGREKIANFYKLLYFPRIVTTHQYFAALLLCLAPAFAAADQTEWLVAPYGWLPTVSVDQTFDDGSGGGAGGGGAEVLSKIDFAVMLRAEAARGHWGAMLDYIYVSLADQTTYSPLPAINIVIDGDLDLEVLESTWASSSIGRTSRRGPCSLRRQSMTHSSAHVTCCRWVKDGMPPCALTTALVIRTEL
jgi:hypothetical protein